MTLVKIELPWPPSVNAYWGKRNTGKFVRVFVTHEGKAFRRRAVEVCRQAGIYGMRLGGRLAVKVTLCPPTKRRLDMDNFNKGLLDALSMHKDGEEPGAEVWGDDSQIDDLHVLRGPVISGGKAVVEVSEMAALRPMM